MADSKPPSEPAASGSKTAAPKRNPVFKMMGLPALPRKLPSRNWLIFWTLSASISAAIIYDKREKNRATAKWRRAVAPLALEPISNPSQLPRKLTIYIEAPPGDGLRAAQDHFLEYVKPILGASGFDWEFVQGRQQGDVRAAVAEKIRRIRKVQERPDEELAKTDEAIVEDIRRKNGLPEYDGVKGDIVIGRHAWKEYVRGLHEGWLGSLDPPAVPVVEAPESKPEGDNPPAGEEKSTDGEKPEEEKKPEKKDEKPKRPPQPPPYNRPDDYPAAALPIYVPAEFSPSAVIPLPHRLGFRHTFVRLARFFNRRQLADDIGREVAAVCFAASRDWREADSQYEQQLILKQEEQDWPKFVWQDEPETKADADAEKKAPEPPKEKIWASNLVVDARIMERMRRFEIQPEDESRAQQIVVPEEEIEGWIKRNLRALGRWSMSAFANEKKGPNVGNLDED